MNQSKDPDILALEERITAQQKENREMDRIYADELGLKRPSDLKMQLGYCRKHLNLNQEETAKFWNSIKQLAVKKELDAYDAGIALRLVYETLMAAHDAAASRDDEVFNAYGKLLIMRMPKSALEVIRRPGSIAFIQDICDNIPEEPGEKLAYLGTHFPSLDPSY